MNLTQKRDLVIALKRETLKNVDILTKIQPMSSNLSCLLKGNALEKPTQNFFNHLSHFLVSHIDPLVSLPWPLYDTKTERMYRNELSAFISDYSAKGLLSPVMSSYLVNPGCFKVTNLMYEMSKLAVQVVLIKKMNSDYHINLYKEVTMKSREGEGEKIIESLEKETAIVQNKLYNFLAKRKEYEKGFKVLRDLITRMKFNSQKAEKIIDYLVDGFIEKYSLDEAMKNEILEIKNVQKPAKFFDNWLKELDQDITEMESNWDSKTGALLSIAQTTFKNTETLIARQTGTADEKTFMIEYNPKTDYINTEDLENQVNMHQKYILKNIIRDDKLNFPNLIRGFLIAISYVLKNLEIGNEIFQFNQYLIGRKQNYEELVHSMKTLLERVMNAEQKIMHREEPLNSTIAMEAITEIPPLPDLSELKMNRQFHPQMVDAFTPLNFTKHTFNLRKLKTGSSVIPMSKVFATPFHPQVPKKEDFMKSLISCRVSAYDNMNITQNTMFNMSTVSQATNKGNETIAATGFTRDQISRLLSTRKSSSKKKFMHNVARPDIKIIKGCLFNESNFSNESVGMFRSHSSPNLNENCDKRSRTNWRSRKLSIMKENSPSLLEVSGIAAIERDSSHSTPQEILSLESSRKLIDASSAPSISAIVTPDVSTVSNTEVDLHRQIEFKESQITLAQCTSNEMVQEQIVLTVRNCTENVKNEVKSETPKTNIQVTKTSSLEKIINRFKKFKAGTNLPSATKEENDFKTIFEEKENFSSNVDIFTAHRNLLPDLLSPTCSIITRRSTDFVEPLFFDIDEDIHRRPRESLGAALGVDHTFLDQFDLID